MFYILILVLVFMLVLFVFFKALKLILSEGVSTRPHLNQSPMIILDHQGESSVLNLSYFIH